MKPYHTLLLLLFKVSLATAQSAPTTDTAKQAKLTFTAVDFVPEYPGGLGAFSNYISRTLVYPDVAKLIGINGKVLISFIIERDGKVSSVTPVNCIGAGCESEAVKVLANSRAWKPGIQNGRPVRVQYSIPINFAVEKGKVTMKQLKAAKYGFVFNIKDKIYTLEQAQTILGNSFQSVEVEIAEPFYNEGNDVRFNMPDKKEVYVVKMKG
ncbi:hypothetical protein A0256_09285 [Mucilaginibacter sp. PAMC 26640]|nr:hypothetical protein A0256_09285 [Mucilaginibacter sp. PAMC 26640]